MTNPAMLRIIVLQENSIVSIIVVLISLEVYARRSLDFIVTVSFQVERNQNFNLVSSN